MKITMNDSRLTNTNQLKEFLKGSQGAALFFEKSSIKEKYKFIDETIDRLNYSKLKRKDKRIVINYLKKLTGYKRAQLFRLIKRAEYGKLSRKKYKRKNPNRKYSGFDIKLLERTDELHLRLNALSTKEILRREYEVFNDENFQNISQISIAHINNLRNSPVYKNHWINHTKKRQVPIGITQPPESYGKPGSIKVDTVHQRDVYHINSVDEITQWEIVACVPLISERFLKPALEEILKQYPFKVFNFHSDRGSEYINYVTADLLNRLLIKQTKTRSYRCNDNALVETKNGAVIRKNMGWEHINEKLAGEINQYYKDYFNPYLNFHRPCVYSTRVIKYPNGRKRKVYDQSMPPYEKLKEVTNLKKENFLKPKITFEKLDKIAYRHSDNQFAKLLREKERKLFEDIRKSNQSVGSHHQSGT